MAVEQPAKRYSGGPLTASRLLMFIACVLFVVASLGAGGFIKAVDWLPWALGGLAAVALAWAA